MGRFLPCLGGYADYSSPNKVWSIEAPTAGIPPSATLSAKTHQAAFLPLSTRPLEHTLQWNILTLSPGSPFCPQYVPLIWPEVDLIASLQVFLWWVEVKLHVFAWAKPKFDVSRNLVPLHASFSSCHPRSRVPSRLLQLTIVLGLKFFLFSDIHANFVFECFIHRYYVYPHADNLLVCLGFNLTFESALESLRVWSIVE